MRVPFPASQSEVWAVRLWNWLKGAAGLCWAERREARGGRAKRGLKRKPRKTTPKAPKTRTRPDGATFMRIPYQKGPFWAISRTGACEGVGLGLDPKRATMVQNTTTIGIFAFFGSEMTLGFLFGVVGRLFWCNTLHLGEEKGAFALCDFRVVVLGRVSPETEALSPISRTCGWCPTQSSLPSWTQITSIFDWPFATCLCSKILLHPCLPGAHWTGGQLKRRRLLSDSWHLKINQQRFTEESQLMGLRLCKLWKPMSKSLIVPLPRAEWQLTITAVNKAPNPRCAKLLMGP